MDKKAESYFYLKRMHASEWTKNFIDRAHCPIHKPLFSEDEWYTRNTDIWIWPIPSKTTNTKFAKHSPSN